MILESWVSFGYFSTTDYVLFSCEAIDCFVISSILGDSVYFLGSEVICSIYGWYCGREWSTFCCSGAEGVEVGAEGVMLA